MQESKVNVIGRLVSNSGKVHQNQEVYNTSGLIGNLRKTSSDTQKVGVKSIILIGGMQKHQAIKTNGICTTLSASMGMGGGYVPMVLTYIKKLDNEKYDNSNR